MTRFAELLSTVFERRVRFRGLGRTDNRPISELAATLVGTEGEVSGRTIGGQILERYELLDNEEKVAFFQSLTTEMDIDADTVRTALNEYEKAPSRDSYRAFVSATEPNRQELIRRLNMVPGATGQLVKMRADLLRLARDNPGLSALDPDFQHLFTSWFNRGFLVLVPITWDSSARVLEKIIAYEAVHAIDSWDDLRQRVEPTDRRCFAFFHPAMPDEPLIFVQVALTKEVPNSIQGLLAGDSKELPAEDASTAVFYSISNCQSGLANISFGNSLIKQVASDLSAELPGLKTFVTLSPMPDFTAWLKAQRPDHDPENEEHIRALAAHYLMEAKRSDGQPLDPVARFHLGNGALVQNVHAGADTSPKGVQQSFGVMVNYRYDLNKVSQNHEAFATARSVAASPEIRSLSASIEKTSAVEAQ